MEKIIYKSSNGSDDILGLIWEAENPKFILQIIHGMSEHILRYDDFAKFLNSKGIIVCGNNHLGHGETAKKLGYFGRGDNTKYVIEDVKKLSNLVKDRYNLPIYYLGHSMGSFILRYFISLYEVEKAVVMGTGYISNLQASLALLLTKFIGIFKKDKDKSKLLIANSIGRYEMKKVPNAWISYNDDNVIAYQNDPYCAFTFTINGYVFLFSLLKLISKKNIISNTNKDISLYFMSGSEDAVGAYEKGVKKVFNLYKSLGYKNIKLKFFKNMRHEILNEKDNMLVYEEIYNFLKN